MRAVILDQRAVVEDGDLVEIDDGLEFVRHGDDGVLGEFLADDALDEGVDVDGKGGKYISKGGGFGMY